MGSIAIRLANEEPAQKEAIQRMLAAAPHRGRHIQIEALGRVALGVSNDGEIQRAWLFKAVNRCVAFSGALDNLDELREELERSGVQVPETSPAGIVAAAFARWGDDAPTRLRGVFVGAISDGTTLRVFRDHVGFQPLFYRYDAHGFTASNEAKQVIAGAGIPREPDLEGLEGILFGGSGRRKVALKGVERFPSGSIALVEPCRPPTFRLYWDPTGMLETSDLTLDETVLRLRELLEQAVRRCVTGRDAVSLSGGLDSPSVAAFAAPVHLERGGERLRAVSAVFPHLPSVDESRYIEIVCDYLDIPLRTYVPTARSLDDLEHWVRVLDAPVDTISIPAFAELYRTSRQAGARAVLTGELAEYVVTLQQHLLAHLLLHRRVRPFARRVREERQRGQPWRSITQPLVLSLSPPALATRYKRRYRRDWRGTPAWIDSDAVRGIGERPDLAHPARRRWLVSQVRATGQGHASSTLEADEICASYCGVQIRRPFADVDLWEFFLSMRAEIKFPTRTSKILIRRAVDGLLPDEIVWRRDKTAFDRHVLATAEWPELRRWILGSEHRIAGIDYGVLAERLSGEDMDVMELRWTRDLARVHAFLEQWA